MNKRIQQYIILMILILAILILPSCNFNTTKFAQETINNNKSNSNNNDVSVSNGVSVSDGVNDSNSVSNNNSSNYSNNKRNVMNELFTDNEKEKMGITDKTSVEIYSSPLLKNQYFVKVITEIDWSEVIYQITVNEDEKKIESMLADDGYAIVDDITLFTQVNALELPDKYLPILLALTTSSHMGNGKTSFFAFTQDGTMVPMFTAGHTVDREKDTTNGQIFERGRLSISLRPNNSGSEYSDIVFKGRGYLYGIKDKDTTHEYLYQIVDIERVYSFNSDASVYEETLNNENIIETIDGITSYTDFWKE